MLHKWCNLTAALPAVKIRGEMNEFRSARQEADRFSGGPAFMVHVI